MRVGLDVYQAGHAYGGIARYVRSLVPALTAAAPSDQFILFSNHLRPPEAEWRYESGNARRVNLRLPRRLAQTCWDYLGWPPIETVIGAVDVFHGTHFMLPAVRAARRVLTVHDVMFLRHPELFADRSANERWHRKELLTSLDRTDMVMADSQCTRSDLMEVLDYPKERIRVVLLGVEERFFATSNQAVADVAVRYGLERPYLVFLVGTPEPRKNLRRTVEAARLAAPDLPLVILGRAAPIRSFLGGDQPGVRLPGAIPDADLPLLLRGAELALYPSLYEGFGLPALEALAAGVPLITSDRGSLPEVVGDAAVLVDPESVEAMAHAIRRLRNDTERRARFVERGVARARELSWRRTAEQVLQVYRELV